MCEICTAFEGWTVGDALGLKIPVCTLVTLDHRTGVFGLARAESTNVVYGQLDGTRILHHQVEGITARGTRPQAEYYRNDGLGGHLVGYCTTTGRFVPAVPLTWRFGLLLEEAVRWQIEGRYSSVR